MEWSVHAAQMYVPVLITALSAVTAVIWWLSSRSGGKTLPSPWAIPFIGDTFTNITRGPAAVGKQHHAKLGKLYWSWFLGERMAHIGDADAVKRLLNAEHDLVEQSWPFTIKMLVGQKAITNTTGSYHMQVRKTLAPAFTPKATQQYIPRIVEIAQELCAKWAAQRQVKGEDCVKAYTFQVATELIVGFKKGFATKALLARHQKLWAIWLEGFLSLPINLPGFAFHRAMQARRALLNEYEDHILALMQKDAKPEEHELKTSMQMIIEAAKEGSSGEWDLELLKDNAINLLFAGHDTSASISMLLLRFLKQEPATLQRLRDEQQQVMESYGSNIDSESLRAMPYTDAVVQEGMRMIPAVATVFRVALKSFVIGGYTIPKGHKLQLELWKVMEEDARWTGLQGDFAANVFNPDRWLTEEGKKVGSYLPFGSGARMCLGYSFASLEIKVLMAVLARSYDWQVDLNESVKTFPLPTPVNGLPMIFTSL